MGYKLKRITMWKEKTITPREPSANTLFYYKFEWDLVNEVTWTADCSFSWTGSYDTVDWVECVNLNNTWLTLSAKLPANDFTLCWYGNFISFAPDTFNGVIWILGTGNSWIHCQLIDDQYSSIWPSLNMYNYATWQWTSVAISDGYTTWQRYCYTLVRSSGVCTLYVNGVSQASITTWWNNSQSVQYYLWEVYNNTRYYHGYMSKAIMENVAWSVSDVQAYFNNTKEEYGYPAPSPILEELVIYPKKVNNTTDFRNKTQAQVEADWWTVDLPFNTDSVGWYAAPPWALNRPIDMTDAKKLTITAELYVDSSSNKAINFWLTWWSPINYIYAFVNWSTYNKWVAIHINWTQTPWSDNYTIDWTTTITYEINLQTYEIKVTAVNNWNTQSATTTTTATVINAILSSNTTVNCYSDTANNKMATYTYTIEY